MSMESPTWKAQWRGWRTLRGLRPTAIDLERIALIRAAPLHDLAQPDKIEKLLLNLGLNDEGIDEFPAVLHPFCGSGLRIWQYPSQFSKYLLQLSGLHVRSYLEIGVRHGGSFVATVELLNRFFPLEFAVAIDILPAPSMTEYMRLNVRATFECVSTQSPDFETLLDRFPSLDLVFIDSHHEESHCRRELAAVRDKAKMIALHDISNVNCPGIARVWEDVKSMESFHCYEFTDQYEGMGPYMGIGLAVAKGRLNCG